MEKIHQKLITFCKQEYPRNAWLEIKGIKVYLRHSQRLIDEQMVPMLDIGSIEINPPGKGTFKRLLQLIIQVCPHSYIFVENVHNKRFAEYFLKNGWKPSPCYPLCFYLKVK